MQIKMLGGNRAIVPIFHISNILLLYLLLLMQVVHCRTCRSIYGLLVKQKQHDKYRKYGSGSFVIECRNLKHDGLCTHQINNGHKLATEIYKNRNAKPAEIPTERESYAADELKII